MEVSKFSESGIRIKTKTALFGVNPVGAKKKETFDASLFLQHAYAAADLSVEGDTVIINGPGEYEIKSIKITGLGKGEEVAYTARIEGIQVLVVKASALAKQKEMTQDCQMLLVEADVPVEENFVAATNAQVAVLFGPQAQEAAKQLGKEVAPVAKYAVTREKLPTETEIVVLG